MKNTSWKDYAELIGISAIVASLIFVGLQMRQDREIALASVQAAFMETLIAINNDINLNADIWNKGLAGGELSGSETIVFRNIVANLRDHAALQSQNIRTLGGPGDFSTFKLADLIRRHPGLQKESERRGEIVRIINTATSTPLRSVSYPDQIQEAIERLNQLDP